MEQTIKQNQGTPKPQPNMLPLNLSIKELDIKQVAGLVTRIFMLKNQKTDEASLIFTANELQTQLKEHYYYLTFGEVKQALENGVFGNYGEYYGISVVTMCGWLDKYLGSEERMRYLESQRPKLKAITQTATRTKEEKEDDMRNLVLSKFERFIVEKKCDFFVDITYKFMLELKLINPDTEYKNKMMQKADKILSERKKIAEIKSLQDLFRQREADNAQTYNEKRINTAKRLIIEEYFRGIIADKKEAWLKDKLKPQAFKKTKIGFLKDDV